VGIRHGTASKATQATRMRSLAQGDSSEQGIHSVNSMCIVARKTGKSRLHAFDKDSVRQQERVGREAHARAYMRSRVGIDDLHEAT